MSSQRMISVAGTGVALVIIASVVGSAATYTIDEAEQAVVVQFGAPVGDPVTEPGLHFKLPFVQEVRIFEKRTLAWDGDPNQVPTRGREFISVDTAARWRISEPLTFLESLRDETGAQSRLDDVIDSVVRDKISSTSLEEIVRSTTWEISEEQLESTLLADEESVSDQIELGREGLTRQILEEAKQPLAGYGIELVDVRIKRLNYVESVQRQVFNRMISERQRIAAQFRSEGQGTAAEILGQTDKQLAEIRSEAARRAEVILGEAEAEATAIFNQAYSVDPEFYGFYRTLESYRNTIGPNTTLMLDRGAEFFRYLQDAGGTPESSQDVAADGGPVDGPSDD